MQSGFLRKKNVVNVINKESAGFFIYALIVIAGLFQAQRLYEAVPAFAMPVSKRVVLIDAGHGGWDPGKVSGKVQEKDINLEIARKLQTYLELGGATVIVTRFDDDDVARTKSSDMYKRKMTSNTSQADIFVSIHQNSFDGASVRGAQVFYFNRSDSSKRLAECIQSTIKDNLIANNRFEAKPNDNYYVLKQTSMPAVLVECGFLSNSNDKYMLTQDEYQEKMAWSIYMGIVAYFDGVGLKEIKQDPEFLP